MPIRIRIMDIKAMKGGETMRKLLLAALVLVTFSSCATVIRKDLMETGARDISLEDMTRDPARYTGKLFILGGTIVNTTVTETGSLINAVYIPVNKYGHLKDRPPDGRFLALYPKERGILDPILYDRNRQITVAATFTGTQRGKIGQMDYIFPVFLIEQIYLWPRVLYYPYPYPYYYWGPYWGPPFGPWGPYSPP